MYLKRYLEKTAASTGAAKASATKVMDKIKNDALGIKERVKEEQKTPPVALTPKKNYNKDVMKIDHRPVIQPTREPYPYEKSVANTGKFINQGQEGVSVTGAKNLTDKNLKLSAYDAARKGITYQNIDRMLKNEEAARAHRDSSKSNYVYLQDLDRLKQKVPILNQHWLDRLLGLEHKNHHARVNLPYLIRSSVHMKPSAAFGAGASRYQQNQKDYLESLRHELFHATQDIPLLNYFTSKLFGKDKTKDDNLTKIVEGTRKYAKNMPMGDAGSYVENTVYNKNFGKNDLRNRVIGTKEALNFTHDPFLAVPDHYGGTAVDYYLNKLEVEARLGQLRQAADNAGYDIVTQEDAKAFLYKALHSREDFFKDRYLYTKLHNTDTQETTNNVEGLLRTYWLLPPEEREHWLETMSDIMAGVVRNTDSIDKVKKLQPYRNNIRTMYS